MALAWFICQYRNSIITDYKGTRGARVCTMDDFTPQIRADGGAWAESEVLGNYAIVKVRANAATLTTIGATAGFNRITNHWLLTDILADLTTTQRNAVQTRILAMGYTQAEINAVMGNTLALWRQKTFLTLLNFVAQRRLIPHWDAINLQIVFDGAFVPCKSISQLNTEVT
jgi:hypothetical protein